MQTLYEIVLTNILNEMKRQNLNQRDISDCLGIAKSTVTDWKSGKSKSYMKHLPQIAEFLGVPESSLTAQKNKTASDERSLTETEKELLAVTADMDEDEKNALLGYAARLIAKRKKED